MKKKTGILALAAVMIMTALMLLSCLRDVAEVSEHAGVGRDVINGQSDKEPQDEKTPDDAEKSDKTPTTPEDPDGEKTENGEKDPDGGQGPDDTPDTPDTATGKMWEYKDGKYIYHFPKRDKSGEKNLSDIAHLYGTAFDDQPDDWYCGKSTYDETTGEATYVWDRYQSTIDTVEKYGAIYRGDTEKKVCYFTFDCGYEFGPTPKILDTLKEKGVAGTFFLTGDYVESEHDLIKRMLDEGHIVGNHTVNHVHCNQVSGEEFIKELEGLEDMFYEQFPDADPMIFFRPPYGNCNEYVLALNEKMGYHTVMWSYTYMDYDTDNQLSYDDAMAKVKAGLHPGAVYLFHTESVTNAAILGEFIDWVRGQGYEIMPICDVIG